MSIILGINLEKREDCALKVQEILSKYGCYIKTRIGLHQASIDFCSPKGLIILELLDNQEIFKQIKEELSLVKCVQVREMIFQ